MKRIAAALVLALASICGWSQAVPISNGVIVNQGGQPVPHAIVRVCSVTSTVAPNGQCTPTAPVYLDYSLTIPSPNSFQADQYGNYTVYGGALSFPNMYLVQIIPQSGVTYSYIVNGPACSLAGCTFTGPVTAPFFNATQSPYYEVNGVQLACADLSDCSNLAKLNAANVFTGTPQTAPTWNATTEFDVNGVQIAAANLSNGTTGTGQVVLANTPTLITPNIGAATGTSLALSSSLSASSGSFSGNATAAIFGAGTGFQIAGAAPLNHVLVGNGTDYVDVATIPSAALPVNFYQTVINGSHAGDAVTQRSYLAVGSGTGMVAVDVVGIGTQVGRTLLNVNATTGLSGLITDPFVVNAAGPGGSGNCMQWDTIGGAGDSGAPCPSGGSGSTATTGYYVTPFGVVYEWGIIAAFDTGPQTVSLPFLMPHALFNVQVTQCYDTSYCGAGATTTTRQWEWGVPTASNFQVRNDGMGAATYFATGW